MRALSIAATGMSAQQTNVEVIANNIANSNTTAFKRSQAQFADLIYQVERAAGVPNQGNSPLRRFLKTPRWGSAYSSVRS